MAVFGLALKRHQELKKGDIIMKNVSKYIAILLVFTALTTIYLTGCGCSKKTESAEPETTVISEEISEADMIIKQADDGNLYAYYNDTVVDSYTGVLKDESGTWYYVKDGKVDLTYTGFASNSEGEWYIKDGKVDFSYNGETDESATNADGSATTDKVVVENGKVVKKNGEEVTTPASTTKITVTKVVEQTTKASGKTTKKSEKTTAKQNNTTAGTTKASTTAGTTKKSEGTTAKQNTTTTAKKTTTTTKATTQAAKITQADMDELVAYAKSYAQSKGYAWASRNELYQYGDISFIENKESIASTKQFIKEDIDSMPQYQPDVTGYCCWYEKEGNGYRVYIGEAY